ncbi:flagellar biosynthesis anti-sigma factor FlgM [Clostridium estertheticum]|uniref:flagellar biosynthesis anti-sigma factor FlgM n=1 Tax=Clostridium estertheticum TaxID=238834 RepID=UPI001CF2E678|nr:flagellar biosynthesis anti-sigma factor FlgM [Clostridium estertheticum]MCB2308806.1 flagellar biosynthesis anti-sigma factor FlgM [Clostridium estertheticum]MCB2347116.1 flagellar biosynthesis anti-sigma factor FlgM [Clostridium estertheticum]MCB2351792.1 flagellar biosynthesis anti-sigma factor FlgM [Clostridium estertheticum]WAG44486.1 flagellar biosynthesis anti-sigma factor FlgM [Clostridium estertheticum]
MKIDGVKPNIINFYKKNTNKAEVKATAIPKDTIELSAAGKSLSALALDGKSVNSNEKIVDIKNKLNNGTYNVDSKLVAKKIIDNMKGRDI